MRIRIISGTYGRRGANSGRVYPVLNGEVCDVAEAEAKRLILLGVAASVIDEPPAPVATPQNNNTPATADGNTPGGNDDSEPPNDADTLDIVDGHFVAEDLQKKLTEKDLRQMAADMGLDVSKLKGKKNIAAAIAEVEVDTAVLQEGSDDDDSEPPSLGAAPPVE